MSSSSRVPAKNIEGRSFSDPIILRGGVDQETSKFAVAPGTLADCLNYVSGSNGYEAMSGLMTYDGTYDQPVSNLLMISVDDDESTFSGGTTDFTLGGQATWGVNNEHSGTVVFFDRVTGVTPDVTHLGLAGIDGDLPSGGHIIRDTTTGVTLTLNDPLTHPIVPLTEAIRLDTGEYWASTIEEYRDLLLLIQNYLHTREAVTDYHDDTPFAHLVGAIPGYGPILGGWQYDDYVYAVKACPTVAFTNGGQTDGLPIYPGQIIQVPYYGNAFFNGYAFVRVLEVYRDSGNWEDGTANGYLLVGPSSGSDPTDINDLYRSTYTFRYVHPDYLDDGSGLTDDIKNTAGTVIGAVASAGSATGVKSGTVNPHLPKYGGLVWKAETRGWTFVNTGWNVPFHSGANAPNVPNAPLFQNDVVALSTTYGPTMADLGTDTAGPAFTDWVNMTNIYADDGSYATCNLPAGWQSETLKVRFPPLLDNGADVDDVTITGIEVTVQARQTGTGTPHDVAVYLIGHLAGASRNKASMTPLSGTVLDYVYGGPDDLWGLDEITLNDVHGTGFQIELQYENATANAGQVEIDYVSATVHYAYKRQRIYFHNPVTATDVCYGDVVAYQQTAGDFSIDTAEGILSFSIPDDVTASQELLFNGITGGIEIRTEASGGGDLIAITDSSVSYNMLPGSEDMTEAESLYQVITANFFENDETTAVYGVTGAGPAFSFSDNGFFFIRTPLLKVADKPRHLAFHDNRLALGFKPGFVALSAPGVPSDFSGMTGADPSLWGVGDRVTGLLSVPGNVLCVFSDSSIRTLEGSGEDTGTMRVVSANSGAKEYTVALIGEPVFADNRGISSLSVSDKYGDFSLGRLTDRIRTWIQSRTQTTLKLSGADNGPLIAFPVRNKNQYRIFFKDGYGLCLYFAEDGAAEPTFFHYGASSRSADALTTPDVGDMIPTWVDSSVLSTGRERIVMGTSSGLVLLIDMGYSHNVDGTNIKDLPRWLILNPINVQSSELLSKTAYMSIQGRMWGYLPTSIWVDTNYEFDRDGETPDDTVVSGALSDPPTFVPKQFIIRPYMSTLTDGLVIKLGTNIITTVGSTTYDGNDMLPPHSFQSIILRSSTTAANRTRASKEY